MLTFVKSVSDCLDRMIRQESHPTTLSLFEEFVNGDSWMLKIRDLRKTYESYADPDALALVPELVNVFDEKGALVRESFRYNPILMDRLLTLLSQQRKTLGFDERERKVSRNSKAGKSLDRAR